MTDISAAWILTLNNYLIYILVVFIGTLIFKAKAGRLMDYVVAMLTGGLLSEGIKYFVNKPRPESQMIFEGSSFPSTHTTLAFTAVFFYVFCCHSRVGDRAHPLSGRVGRFVTVVIVSAMALVVGILRVLVGAHYFADIVAGMVLGLLVSIPFKYYDVSAKKVR